MDPMQHSLDRARMVLGDAGLENLSRAHVLVVGLGGVGSYAAEAVARSGVGKITLVDHDTVDETNLNRQLCALRSTIGRYKADVVAERLSELHEGLEICPMRLFYHYDTRDEIFADRPDYVLDCIDKVGAKIDLIETAQKLEIPILSALGTGKKLDPFRLRLCDIYETYNDGLARVMRRELRKRGIERLRVVCSDEEAVLPENKDSRTPGSLAWVPGCAGLMMAGICVRELAEGKN